MQVPVLVWDKQLLSPDDAITSVKFPRKRGKVKDHVRMVVGDLENVLGELKTVVGDLRVLVDQIDVVTEKIDKEYGDEFEQKVRRRKSASELERNSNQLHNAVWQTGNEPVEILYTKPQWFYTNVSMLKVNPVVDSNSNQSCNNNNNNNSVDKIPRLKEIGNSQCSNNSGYTQSPKKSPKPPLRATRPISYPSAPDPNKKDFNIYTCIKSKRKTRHKQQPQNIITSPNNNTCQIKQIKTQLFPPPPECSSTDLSPEGFPVVQTRMLPQDDNTNTHQPPASVGSCSPQYLDPNHIHCTPCSPSPDAEYCGVYERVLEMKLELQLEEDLDNYCATEDECSIDLESDYKTRLEDNINMWATYSIGALEPFDSVDEKLHDSATDVSSSDFVNDNIGSEASNYGINTPWGTSFDSDIG